MNFPEYLKSLRKGLFSQRELADKIGISHSYISKLENGIDPPPSNDILLRMAEALNANSDEILIAAGRMPLNLKKQLDQSKSIKAFLDTVSSDYHQPSAIHSENINWNMLYSDLFNTSPQAMLLIDYTNLNIIHANESACQLYGYKHVELAQLTFDELTAQVKSVFESGLSELNKKSFSFEQISKDGVVIPVEVLFNVLITDNSPIIHATIYKVSSIQYLLAKYSVIAENFELFTANSSLAIHVYKLDENGKPDKYVLANQAALNLLEYTKDEFLNLSPIDIDDEDARELISFRIKTILKKGHTRFKAVHQTKSGQYIPVEINSHLSRLDDFDVVISIIRDLRTTN